MELSTGWRVWMILLVPVTSPSLWPHWRVFSQATIKSYFSNECWCFWIEHGMVVFIVLIISVASHAMMATAKVSFNWNWKSWEGEFVPFSSSHSRWNPVKSSTCSSTLAPFQNMLLINNISRNQYHYCLQIILNSTVVSTDRCVLSATVSVCWRPTPPYHVVRMIIIKI